MIRIVNFFLLFATAGSLMAQQSAINLADSLYAVGKYTAALESLESISPRTEAVSLKLAKFQMSRGQTAAALENYRSVLDQNPDRVLTAINYAAALVKTNQLQASDSVYLSLIERYPDNANFYYQRGLIAEREEREEALELYKKTVDLEISHPGALYKLAKYELQKGSYDMAKNYCLLGLEVHPDNVSLLSVLGQTYSAMEQYKKAIPVYEKLLTLGQESEFILTKLGYAYYQERDLKAAIEIYKRALELEDRNSAVHYTLGKLYATTLELDKSEAHLLMSILIKKQAVDAEYLSLGLTYKLKKQYKDAYDYLNKALEENPQNERALYERAIAADNYFEDITTRINFYKAYLSQYETTGNEDLRYLAKTRIRDLKKEQHLAVGE